MQCSTRSVPGRAARRGRSLARENVLVAGGLSDTADVMTTAIAFKGVTPFLKTKDLAQTIRFYVTLPGFVVDSQWPADNPTDCILEQRSGASRVRHGPAESVSR